MIAVIQRVSRASVEVDGRITGRIGRGLLILLGVHKGDGEAEADFLANKIGGLRIFNDERGKMNLSCGEVGPGEAARLYNYFCGRLRQLGYRVETGEFGAMMNVELVNDGPVTFVLEAPPK